MDSPLPPDPYEALGLTSAATAEEIRKAYRSLALKLHPDKCHDESQKAQRTDEFTKIQQAWEIINDDEKRGMYDAMVRMAELRRKNMELRSQAPRDVRTAAYDIRTAAPREASFTTRGPTRDRVYEERRPRYYEYEEREPARASARKGADYDEYAHVKRASPPREKERERVRVPAEHPTTPEERRRAERRRDVDVKESRSRKYEREDWEEERRRRDEEELRKKAKAEAKRPTPVRREETYTSYSGTSSSAQRKMEEAAREAQRHMEARSRPSAQRASSSRENVQQYYDAKSDPKRSSAAPKEKERTRETRRTPPIKEERRKPAAAEYGDSYDRRVPSMATQTSSPPVMETSREIPLPSGPRRSFTSPVEAESKRKERELSPPPSFHRSSTMPINGSASIPAASSRRKESAAPQASKLRNSETSLPPDSGYSSPADTPGYTTKTYVYPEATTTTPPLRAEAGNAAYVTYSNGHRTVLREPSAARREPAAGRSSRIRSPSPVRVDTRPTSSTASKMASLDPKRYPPTSTRTYAYPPEAATATRPSATHTSSSRAVPAVERVERSSRRDRERERERDYDYDDRPRGKLYGERGPGYTQPPAFKPEEVSYGKRYDMDDVRFAGEGSRGRERERDADFSRPGLGRSTTYVY